MTVKLSLRDVVVHRSKVEVLRIPDLEGEKGEIMAILGANGAGKSTLLQVLAFLERPTNGQVLFDGQSGAGRELSLRRRMAMVFQESFLLNRSVKDNVALGLVLRGVSHKERMKRAQYWLERLDIEKLADRPARSISGGEAQRVSLARAFALEPEVMFLDEPFASLDQPTRDELLGQLGDILKERDMTVVFVTHDRTEAMQLAKRIAVMVKGRIAQLDVPSELMAHPVDEMVASYLGVAKPLENNDVTSTKQA